MIEISLNIFYVHKYFSPQIKFDPVTPTPPYSEGEYYTTERRNLSLEVRGLELGCSECGA